MTTEKFRIALDTNVLVYAEGANDLHKKQKIKATLDALSSFEVLIPVQVIGELFNVLTRKFGRSADSAHTSILAWHDSYGFIDIREETTFAAIELSKEHALSIWDAVILAASAQAGCRILLSEDMQHGFTWSGTTVVNPFLASPHPLLAPYLNQ